MHVLDLAWHPLGYGSGPGRGRDRAEGAGNRLPPPPPLTGAGAAGSAAAVAVAPRLGVALAVQVLPTTVHLSGCSQQDKETPSCPPVHQACKVETDCWEVPPAPDIA